MNFILGAYLHWETDIPKMNRDGCANGLATDQVFFTGNPAGACDGDLNGFIATAVIILALKAYTAAQHSISWLRREQHTKSRRQNVLERQRVPFVPILSCLLLVTYIVYFVGTGTNAFNVFNGWTLFLFGFGWLIFGILSILYLLKFVSLGHRIAPRTKSNLLKSMSGLDKLSKLDTTGKISLGLCCVVLLIQTVLLCIVQMIPGINREIIIRVAIGFEGWFVLQHVLSINHHFQRVKGAIWESREANKQNASENASKELDLVVKKLTNQQIVLCACSSLSVTSHTLVTAGVLVLKWYIPILFMAIETANFLLIALTDVKMRRKKHRAPKKHENGVIPFEGQVGTTELSSSERDTKYAS